MAVILLPIPTRADEAQNTALARSLFEEGVAASDSGDWERAIERFSRAYALRPSPGIAFNLASAEIETGQIVRAAEHLRAVLNDASAPDEIRERSRTRLDQIAPRIAYATVHVDAPADGGFELQIDKVSLPAQAWGAATPVDPGEHVFDLVRGGEVQDSRTLTLQDGERTELTLTGQMQPEPVAAPLLPATPPPEAQPMPLEKPSDTARPSDKRWVWWTSLGVAVAAGAAVGIVLLTRDDGAKTEAPVMGNTSEGVIRW